MGRHDKPPERILKKATKSMKSMVRLFLLHSILEQKYANSSYFVIWEIPQQGFFSLPLSQNWMAEREPR